MQKMRETHGKEHGAGPIDSNIEGKKKRGRMKRSGANA